MKNFVWIMVVLLLALGAPVLAQDAVGTDAPTLALNTSTVVIGVLALLVVVLLGALVYAMHMLAKSLPPGSEKTLMDAGVRLGKEGALAALQSLDVNVLKPIESATPLTPTIIDDVAASVARSVITQLQAWLKEAAPAGTPPAPKPADDGAVG